MLETLPLLENSDDFVFDNQMIAQAAMLGFSIGEISCPTKYFEEASSINFKRSVKYGLEVLATTIGFVAHKWGIRRDPRYGATGRKRTEQIIPRFRTVPEMREAPNMTMSHRLAVIFVLLSSGISLLWGWSLGRTISGGPIDFQAIYYGSRCLIQHHNPYSVAELEMVYRNAGGKHRQIPSGTGMP